MNLTQLKEEAQADMKNHGGEWGVAEAILGGEKVVVFAKHIGCNKPGRKAYTKFTMNDKPC